MNFEGAEGDGNSVAETNLPDILTCNGLIFVDKEHTTKSTKIYTPRKFLRVWFMRLYNDSYLQVLHMKVIIFMCNCHSSLRLANTMGKS